jgi:hypothetical protein
MIINDMISATYVVCIKYLHVFTLKSFVMYSVHYFRPISKLNRSTFFCNSIMPKFRKNPYCVSSSFRGLDLQTDRLGHVWSARGDHANQYTCVLSLPPTSS